MCAIYFGQTIVHFLENMQIRLIEAYKVTYYYVGMMKTNVLYQCLGGRTIVSRLCYGSLLLLLMIGLRWAWIDCDGGTASLTEYGYFQTDEGFYAGGGKQKFLYDQFVNVTRAAPCTYAICPATHLLTWSSFLLFGQNTWAHRFFPLLINTLAWLLVFRFLSRRTPPWIAFLLCVIVQLNPFLIVYGRTACNDTLMGSIVLMGYVLCRKKGILSAFLGGVVFGLGLWVKQSIWVLFLLGLGGAVIAAPPSLRWRRLLTCAAGFLASVIVQYMLIRLMIYRDALAQDVTIQQMMQISNTSYSLPNPFDWLQTFKGVSSFPRFPTGGLLGIFIPLFIALPALLLFRRLSEAPVRWDGRLLLYLTLPLYAAGIMILPVYYAHYFIPIIAFLPVLWFEARHDIRRWGDNKAGRGLLLAGIALASVMITFYSTEVSANEAGQLEQYLANAYNLPKRIFWAFNGGHILATAALLTLLAGLTMRRPTATQIGGLLLSALVVADLCYSRLPVSEAYKYTPLFPPTMKDMAYLFQVVSICLFFAIWGMPGLLRSTRWPLFFLALFAFGMIANPRWRNGISELGERGHLHKKAVTELAAIVPTNAVVFGERAPQLMLSLQARVSPLPNADPVPTVLKVHAKFPDRPLFALLDSEHTYHYTHYENNKDKLRYVVVHALKLPSFNNSKPIDVFLVRLYVLTNSPPAAAGAP